MTNDKAQAAINWYVLLRLIINNKYSDFLTKKPPQKKLYNYSQEIPPFTVIYSPLYKNATSTLEWKTKIIVN